MCYSVIIDHAVIRLDCIEVPSIGHSGNNTYNQSAMIIIAFITYRCIILI